eukprot:CAMPEP_0183337516 /NCGR_PEP_ID=MMETSP0164_2-20130417/5126_1 /TAXON_ID=221442 /ORGANISM="Coccolithus pelagicus ssp braarudi, Strain PLY182g" /LENGTH=384 /DNA_ID=CAMNT_0025507213 /DNA_START=17 /DNA_END=1168 /DNA_ORIENTATION=+
MSEAKNASSTLAAAKKLSAIKRMPSLTRGLTTSDGRMAGGVMRTRSTSHQSEEMSDCKKQERLSQRVRKSLASPRAFDDGRIGSWTLSGKVGDELKTNQDRGVVVWPFNGKSTEALLCIFDGHGDDGEHVASFVSARLPILLEQDGDSLRADPEGTLRKKIIEVNDDLVVGMGTKSYASTSGCTAAVVYACGDELWVAWVGDSRVVMGTRRGGNVEVAFETDAHKGDVPSEKARVEACGGRVDTSEDPVRVWVDDLGLSMSRSIGDTKFKRRGVIATADVQHLRLDPASKPGAEGDCLLVLASDGVWDVIESDEVCQLVGRHSKARSACQELVTLAQERWTAEEADYRDDTTAIVVFLPFLKVPRASRVPKQLRTAAPSPATPR